MLIVLIELSLRCYGWGATSETRSKIGDFETNEVTDPKFQVQRINILAGNVDFGGKRSGKYDVTENRLL